MFSCEFCLIFQNTFCAKHVWVVTASAKYHFLVASTASAKCLSRRWLYSAKLYKVHKKASAMDSRFHKAVSLHTYICTKKDSITGVFLRIYSLEYICSLFHFNRTFSFWFIPFDFRADQYLLNSPSYFNPVNVVAFEQRKGK